MARPPDPRLTVVTTKQPRMMVYEVELDDGSVAEIEGPEGATEAQLREAMGLPSASLESVTGGLIADPAAQGRPSNPVENFLRGGARGLEEAATGAVQLATNLTPGLALTDVPGRLSDFAAKRQAEYDQSVAAQAPSGQVGRFVGGMAATAPAAPLAIPAKGAKLLPAVGRTAAGSGVIGATATPAVTDDYWQEKAPQFGLGAVLGGALTAGGRGALRAGEEITNLPRRAVNFANTRANRSAVAQEGEDLAARTGIPFTPGQVSGSRTQVFAENMARQSIFTADKAMEADARIADSAINYVRRVAKNMSPVQSGADTVGTQIQGAVRSAVTRTVQRRQEVANKQYGAIHDAIGGRPIVDYSRTREVLERLANPGGTLSGDALRASQQAKKLLGQLDGPRTLRQAIQDRSFWGKGARGGTNVFNDVSPSANRTFSRELFGAIQDDIRAAAAKLDGATTAGPGISTQNALVKPGMNLGQALREADNNYRLYSETIEALEASPMARLLGDDISVGNFMEFNTVPPEKVISKLSAMTPSELNMTRSFMEKNAPETWQEYKRLLIEDALEAGAYAPVSAGVNRPALNPSEFVRALGGNKPAGNAKLQAIMSPGELREINDAFSAMSRMGDKFGTNYSGTDPRAEARSLWEAMRSGSGTAVASTAGQISGLQAVTRVMLNSDGRRALIELSKLPPNARRAPALVAYVTALATSQNTSGQSAQENPR